MKTDMCGTPAGWYRHYRANDPRCEPCAEAWRGYCRQRRKKADRHPCGGCGTPVRSRAKACHDCHVAARSQRKRVAARRRKAEVKLMASAAGSSGGYVWTSGPCAWCDGQFVARGSEPARYCSARCKRSAMKPARGFKVKPSVRLAIYERDHWTCRLCFEPVARDLPPLDNWAPSLDHIECQSWALVPDHSPENLRLAHRWCNSKRSDERYVTAADLAA